MINRIRKVFALMFAAESGRGNTIPITELYRKAKELLTPDEIRRAYFLLGMIVIMAFLEVIGIASIMPFMGVLVNPEVIETNRWLNTLYVTLDFASPERFLFFLGVVVFVLLVISISFKAVTTWAIRHFASMRNFSIAQRLVTGYASQPYDWFLNRNSADLGKAALSEVQFVVEKAIMPMMRILAHGAVVVAILLLLIVVDPILALVIGGVLGGTYGLIYFIIRKLLSRLGADRLLANEMRFKVVNEFFGGIKEIKVSGLERRWLRRFESAGRRFARTQLIANVVGDLPRYLLEVIAFGGMIVLLLALLYRGSGLETVVPIITVYALAGYRMMPALQSVYQQATVIRFSIPAINRLHRDMMERNTGSFTEVIAESSSEDNCEKIPSPVRSISLDNVTYTYRNAKRRALSNLSMSIKAQTTVGLVGKSGSGKTTAVDIILGLLKPEVGYLRVDDTIVTDKNYGAWQKFLGYVPQHIFLSDESVAANIAFGVRTKDIDRNAVERAAKIANLHDFVEEEMPEGYDTIVGERGIRLSGGQRQRIGIARALYNGPKVIVMDEATSALDNMTEQAVMDAVHNLGGSMTVILIAHRLTTVRDCDYIYHLDQGQVIGEGAYDDLIRSDSRFRDLAGEKP